MKEIDWSIAPEGATHWAPETDKDHECWYKKRGNGWMVFSKGTGYEWREISFPKRNLSELIPRPADQTAKDHRHEQPAWTGAGLPPVGTVCEACWTSPDEYYHIKVLAHDDGKAVYRWLTGPGSGELSESEGGIHGGFSKPHPKFRPIRTPEQIAAEEREKAVVHMVKCVAENTAGVGMGDAMICAKALYDAGYRRQEPKE